MKEVNTSSRQRTKQRNLGKKIMQENSKDKEIKSRKKFPKISNVS